jgi:hypothetical protein
MREIRKSGSEGGVGFNPPFLPLSLITEQCRLQFESGLRDADDELALLAPFFDAVAHVSGGASVHGFVELC